MQHTMAGSSGGTCDHWNWPQRQGQRQPSLQPWKAALLLAAVLNNAAQADAPEVEQARDQHARCQRVHNDAPQGVGLGLHSWGVAEGRAIRARWELSAVVDMAGSLQTSPRWTRAGSKPGVPERAAKRGMPAV